MAIKHTTGIFISKFGLVYKIIVYFLIVVLIVGAISFAVAHPALKSLFEKVGDTGFVQHAKSGIGKLVRGNSDFLVEFQAAYDSFEELASTLRNEKAEWAKLTVTFFVSFAVITYLLALSFLPFSDILRNFMSSKSEYGFMSNLVANGGRAALYALFYTLVVFTSQIAITALSVFVFLKLVPKIGVLALTVGYLILTLLSGLKSTIFSGWLPATVTENVCVFKGFVVGIRAVGKKFLRSFWTFVFLSWIMTYLILSFGILTFGVGLIIAVPSLFIMYRIVELVLYFDVCGYRYYVDEQTVR